MGKPSGGKGPPLPSTRVITAPTTWRERAAEKERKERMGGCRRAIDFVKTSRLMACNTGPDVQHHISDFETESVLNGMKGSETVYLATHMRSNKQYALKKMQKCASINQDTKGESREHVFTERNLLARADSQWLVRLYSTFQDATHVFMMMEFLQGENLRSRMAFKRYSREVNSGYAYMMLDVDTTRRYMAELLSALEAVHALGYVHRDVRPENIMITTQDRLKLMGFGLAKHIDGRDETSAEAKLNAASSKNDPPYTGPMIGTVGYPSAVCGTPSYMPPESWELKYSFRTDIWSLGVITYECIIGELPFSMHSIMSARSWATSPRATFTSYDRYLSEVFSANFKRSMQSDFLFGTHGSRFEGIPLTQSASIFGCEPVKEHFGRDVCEFLNMIFVPVDERPCIESCKSSPFITAHLMTPFGPPNTASVIESREILLYDEYGGSLDQSTEYHIFYDTDTRLEYTASVIESREDAAGVATFPSSTKKGQAVAAEYKDCTIIIEETLAIGHEGTDGEQGCIDKVLAYYRADANPPDQDPFGWVGFNFVRKESH